MEGEFESEIAKRVAGKKGHNPSKKAGALLAVVTAFALMSGTAAYALAMKPTSTGMPMTEFVLFDQKQDKYLDDDDTTAALRVMTLKVKGDHATAGDNAMLQNAKFDYKLRVAIYDGDTTWAGMELGKLALPVDFTIDSMSVVVFDSQLVPVDVDPADAFAVDEGGVVTVTIPALSDGADYDAGYVIAISIALGTDVDLSNDLTGAAVTEIAWGDVATSTSVTVPSTAP